MLNYQRVSHWGWYTLYNPSRGCSSHGCDKVGPCGNFALILLAKGWGKICLAASGKKKKQLTMYKVVFPYPWIVYGLAMRCLWLCRVTALCFYLETWTIWPAPCSGRLDERYHEAGDFSEVNLEEGADEPSVHASGTLGTWRRKNPLLSQRESILYNNQQQNDLLQHLAAEFATGSRVCASNCSPTWCRHGYMVRGLCSQYTARKCAHLLGLWESHSHPDLQLEISYNMLNLIYNHHSTVKCLNLIHFHLCSLNPKFYALSHHSCGSKSAFSCGQIPSLQTKHLNLLGLIGLILTILKTFNPFRFLIHPTFGVLFHTSGSRISSIHELGPSQATTWPRTWAWASASWSKLTRHGVRSFGDGFVVGFWRENMGKPMGTLQAKHLKSSDRKNHGGLSMNNLDFIETHGHKIGISKYTNTCHVNSEIDILYTHICIYIYIHIYIYIYIYIHIHTHT